MNRIWRKLAIGLLALLLIARAAAGAWQIAKANDPYEMRMAPGVFIGGLDVAGMTRSQAKKALKEAAEDTILTQPVTLHLPNGDGEITLTPEMLNLTCDYSAAVREAYQAGRAYEGGLSLELRQYLTLDLEPVRELLQSYADSHNTTLTQPSYTLVGETPDLSTEHTLDSLSCQTLTITLGAPESYLDVDAVLEALWQCYSIAYTHPAGNHLEMTVTQKPDAPDVAAIAAEISREPVDDSLNMTTYSFQYGSYGYDFDQAAAEEAISQAGYGETVSVPMTLSAPEITGDAVYFRDVLGSCKTKHNTNENRNTNLRLLSQALDGYILQPGEEFSYNAVVGERTAERGYLPAPAYSGNRLTDSVGGGVCQGSSTLYNCVLLADLEVTNRTCHGAKISYLPLGLDAAVNWGTTDFRFKNNWNFPIMIQAWVTDEYLEMEILGTDEKDYYIELSASSWEDDTVTWAVAYKLKYDKETGELRSKDKIGYSTYYDLG